MMTIAMVCVCVQLCQKVSNVLVRTCIVIMLWLYLIIMIERAIVHHLEHTVNNTQSAYSHAV